MKQLNPKSIPGCRFLIIFSIQCRSTAVFYLKIDASGDIEVDPHHLVEDTGLVLGDAFKSAAAKGSALSRFGHFITPMDDSLAEVTIDACGRPYLSTGRTIRSRRPVILMYFCSRNSLRH